MPRAFVLVLDSFGIGSAPDAADFGDAGADTLGHIAAACANRPEGPLKLPNLAALGLGAAAKLASGAAPAGMRDAGGFTGAFGAAREVSRGKDTPSGHWEMMGVPVRFDWGYFPDVEPCFPAPLIDALVARCGLPGVLGERHASGTRIIADLGAEHLATGKPIVYTSADSVFQIAAHEAAFGLDRLYAVCRVARELVDGYDVGRVIARPFVGEPGHFVRTANRKDYATPPPAPTLLDRLKDAGREVIAIGKIGDIFAHRGPTQEIKAAGDMALFDLTLRAASSAPSGSLTFANFVDFDTLYGHRRDPLGYAAALEAWDARLPELLDRLRPMDVAIVTADHGCDPTWSGTDHTREWVPVLACGPGVAPRDLGRRESFADVAQTVARHLGLAPLPEGHAFLP
ncbi:phosphopentomutase [uncultured Alphaproteobacteria bacterium]|uniref:Phosphopentomutase n=1 Tax=uncultured Alphaproteobacteria bacterium TaxID=91750 RepID=A0A212JAU7_9PROT|nr:phosphopentomutase [uncultured Alphaproteobacteria bacterium]